MKTRKFYYLCEHQDREQFFVHTSEKWFKRYDPGTRCYERVIHGLSKNIYLCLDRWTKKEFDEYKKDQIAEWGEFLDEVQELD